jgi:hypothetical protein
LPVEPFGHKGKAFLAGQESNMPDAQFGILQMRGKHGKILAVDGHQLQIIRMGRVLMMGQVLAMGHGFPLIRNSLLLTPRSLCGNHGLGRRPDQPSLDNRSISAPQRASFFSSASKPRSR